MWKHSRGHPPGGEGKGERCLVWISSRWIQHLDSPVGVRRWDEERKDEEEMVWTEEKNESDEGLQERKTVCVKITESWNQQT